MDTPTTMTTKSRLVLLGIILSINIFAIQAKAQFAYESTRMGIDYKVYIYKKTSLGNGSWKFQAKTVYTCGAAALSGCQPGDPYASEWGIADCWNSTIDGKTVPAAARYGYEDGLPAVFKSVCRL
jgi:hypothetical protein